MVAVNVADDWLLAGGVMTEPIHSNVFVISSKRVTLMMTNLQLRSGKADKQEDNYNVLWRVQNSDSSHSIQIRSRTYLEQTFGRQHSK